MKRRKPQWRNTTAGKIRIGENTGALMMTKKNQKKLKNNKREPPRDQGGFLMY